MKKETKLDLLNIKLQMWDKIVLVSMPVLFVVISILMTVLVYNFVTRQLSVINSNLKDSSYNISLQLNDYIKTKADVLDMLAEFPEVYQMNRETQRAFIKTHAQNAGFRTIFFVDNYGKGYYPDENTVRDQSHEAFFKNISTTNLYVTEPYYPYGEPFTTISRPIYNYQHERVGTICGTVFLRSLQLMMIKYEASSKGSCFIINPKGIIIAGTQFDVVRKKQNIFEMPGCSYEILNDVMVNKKSSFGVSLYQGKKHFTYAYYMKDYDWILVDNMPSEAIMISLVRTIIIFAIFGLSFILFAASTVRVLLSWDKSNDKIYTDPLCKCGSRAACNAMLEELDKRHDKKISIIFADLNRFKYVNDTYGHEAGDEMLKVFSRHLNFIYGDYGFIGRNGGDEFLVFLTNMEESDIRQLWLDLEDKLKLASARLAYDYEITSSYGLDSREPGCTEPLVETLKRADEKMYIDKAERKKKMGIPVDER